MLGVPLHVMADVREAQDRINGGAVLCGAGGGGGRIASTEGRSCAVQEEGRRRAGSYLLRQKSRAVERRKAQGERYLGYKGAGAGHNGGAYSAQGWQGTTGGGVVWSLSFVCPPPSLSLNPLPPHLGVLLEHAIHQIPEWRRVPGGYRGVLALNGEGGGGW